MSKVQCNSGTKCTKVDKCYHDKPHIPRYACLHSLTCMYCKNSRCVPCNFDATGEEVLTGLFPIVKSEIIKGID